MILMWSSIIWKISNKGRTSITELKERKGKGDWISRYVCLYSFWNHLSFLFQGKSSYKSASHGWFWHFQEQISIPSEYFTVFKCSDDVRLNKISISLLFDAVIVNKWKQNYICLFSPQLFSTPCGYLTFLNNFNPCVYTF